jgi:hypothetical protein
MNVGTDWSDKKPEDIIKDIENVAISFKKANHIPVYEVRVPNSHELIGYAYIPYGTTIEMLGLKPGEFKGEVEKDNFILWDENSQEAWMINKERFASMQSHW